MLFEDLDATKVAILLDIDGVLNPFSISQPTAWPDFAHVKADVYDLWLSREMASKLGGLDAQLIWATTWCDDPRGLRTISEFLGIDPWWGGRWGEAFGWKDDLARMAASTFPAVIWIDDDEPHVDDFFNLYRFSPVSTYGLTPQEVVEVEALVSWLDTECPVCGLSGEHPACEDALQVEPYTP